MRWQAGVVEIQAAMLCQAAEVRDGRLYVEGGGVTTYKIDLWPGPVPLTLALVLDGDAHDVDVDIAVEIGYEFGRVGGAAFTFHVMTFPEEGAADTDAVVVVPVAVRSPPFGSRSPPSTGSRPVSMATCGRGCP